MNMAEVSLAQPKFEYRRNRLQAEQSPFLLKLYRRGCCATHETAGGDNVQVASNYCTVGHRTRDVVVAHNAGERNALDANDHHPPQAHPDMAFSARPGGCLLRSGG
ncbi:MAG: hypothetical protein JNK40_10700 [Chromatiales bacterium]|nr:hypothetical protein [Chromatiales bacterium]